MLKLGERERIYTLSLYALLHDVGKVTLRFARRCISGVEPCQDPDADPVARTARQLIEGLHGTVDSVSRRKHYELSKEFTERLLGIALSSADESYVNHVVARCDKFAASERGLFRELGELLEGVWREIEEEVSSGRAFRYSHETTAMLSPTWMLVRTGYLDSVGLRAYAAGRIGRWSGSDERVRLSRSLFYPLLQALEEGDRGRLVKSVASLLRELAEKELWLPVGPLIPRKLLELRALRLDEAMKRSSYSGIVLLLYAMSREAYGLLGSRVSRGLIDTLHSILRATTLLVPSAIYWSLVPDISLYSHSKLVSAYTLALQLSSSLRLLTIDVNRIQEFISSPMKAAAASRVMRGRSLLVELALDALTEYALTLFGELPWTNVIVSEGGTVDLLIPDLPDLNARVSRLRSVASSLASYLGGIIGFTVAYSAPFTIEETSFADTVKALAEGRRARTFADALESLSLSLATEKSKTGCRREAILSGGVVAREDEVEGFDAITLEPVMRGERDPYRLAVTAETKHYADALAPEKLAVGDVISTATHLSLVAGSVARGLAAVLSVHLFRYVDGFAQPDSDAALALAEVVSGIPGVCDGRLLCRYEADGWEFRAALIPLTVAGALYVLVGAPLVATPGGAGTLYDPENPEHIARVYAALRRVLEDVRSALARVVRADHYVRVRVSIANAPHAFVLAEGLRPLYDSRGFDEALAAYRDFGRAVSRLISDGFDVALGYVTTSFYHPAQLTIEKEGARVVGFKLVDLDEFGVVAVAKMDLDLFGEVRSLYSISPSRLITLSDLVNAVIAGKAYMKALELARGLSGSGLLNLDAIPLYAGGDDVTVYGKWSHVVKYVAELYKELRSVLKPLTLSLAVAIGDSTTPLLLLYGEAVALLEGYAKRVKASCVLGGPSISLYPRPQPAQGTNYVSCEVVPLERPSEYYPWIEDIAASWNLQLAAELVDPVAYVKNLGVLRKLEELKRELHILARLAYEYGELVQGGPQGGEGRVERLVPIEILYAYVWSRRGKELGEIKRLLEEGVSPESRGLKILAYPDDIVGKTTVEEALRVLLAAKPVIDLVLLAIRRPDTVEPSRLVKEV
jgi:CRISPR-associated protein Csm1